MTAFFASLVPQSRFPIGQCCTEFVIRIGASVKMITRFFLFRPMNRFRSTEILLFVASLILFSSCERERDGTIDPDLSTPLIETLALESENLNLDTSAVGVSRRPDGTYLISQTVSARVKNLSGIANLRGVYYRIYRPGENRFFSSGTLAAETLASSVTAIYAANISFVMSRPEAGFFRVEVFAQSRSNDVSNFIQLPLRIARNNSTPRILSASVPDTVYLPPGDSLLITMSVAVSDSDGAGDIAGIFFYSLNSSDPTRQFLLSDDGNVGGISGDLLAGDGTYTITVKLLDQGNIRRTFEFEFHAVDQQGADSGPLLKLLTVQ